MIYKECMCVLGRKNGRSKLDILKEVLKMNYLQWNERVLETSKKISRASNSRESLPLGLGWSNDPEIP